MRTLIALICIGLSSPLLAYTPIDILPQGSRVSLLIKTPEERLMSINTEQLFPPASTLKVITALAAKLALGNDFRFTTQIESKDKDLIIRFSGDPTLTTQDLDRLIRQLSKQGIHTIEGNIWLNNGAFSGYERGVGWPWDILGVCYSAPASAITLDGNCIQASIYTSKGGTTRVYVPKHQPITVTTEAIALSQKEQKEKQCDLELTTSDNNKYFLSGCLAHLEKPLPLKFAIQETHVYTKSVLKTLFEKHKITLNGDIKLSSDITGKPLVSHTSGTLDDMLDKMLKRSNNLIADNITKTIGANFYSQPGSFRNGTEAIKQIILSHTGIDLSRAQFADGSGLSRNNRITAHDLSQVLDYIWEQDSRLGLISMLPKAGESGLLKYRHSMNRAPIKGYLQAKSGTINGSYNMAGYSIDDNGKPKALFIQFVSDYYPKERENEDNSISPIFKFERVFYKDVINLPSKNDSFQ